MLDVMTLIGQSLFGLIVIGGLVLAGFGRGPQPASPAKPPSLAKIYLVLGALIVSMFLIGYTTAAHQAVETGDIRQEDLLIK